MDEANSNQTETNWQYNNGQSSYNGSDVGIQTKGVPLPKLPDIQWSASEYIAHSKSGSWYLKLIAGGVVLVVIILLITRDPFAGLAVLLACITLGVYAGRPPETKQYILSEQGVQVDDKMFAYGLFRSFSLVEEGGISSVWLKPLKRFSPMVVMYFPPEDENKIVDMLANFLPHEQRQLDGIDQLSRKMRF